MLFRTVSFSRAGAVLMLGTLALAGCGGGVEHANVSFDLNGQGTALAFSAADGDLYLLQLRRRSVERLTQTDLEESTPVFSPDGQRVTYAAGVSGGATSLFEYSLASRTTRRLTFQDDVRDLSPRYSPDGSQIVFTRANRLRAYSMGGQTWDQWDVYVLERDGSPRRLTSGASGSPNDARFTDGGRKLLFSADGQVDPLDAELYEIELDASDTPRPVERPAATAKQGGAWAIDPDISSDGALTTFISDRAVSYQYDVYVMATDGTPRPLHVTKVARYNQNPRFSSDDKSVWFLAGADWNSGGRPIFSLWRVGIEDWRVEQVADSGLFTHPSRWAPR